MTRRYRPFGKWAHRALGRLPPPGPRLHALLADLVAVAPYAAGPGLTLVEGVSTLLADGLRAQDLSSTRSDFLVDHSREVASRVVDPLLRRIAGSG